MKVETKNSIYDLTRSRDVFKLTKIEAKDPDAFTFVKVGEGASGKHISCDDRLMIDEFITSQVINAEDVHKYIKNALQKIKALGKNKPETLTVKTETSTYELRKVDEPGLFIIKKLSVDNGESRVEVGFEYGPAPFYLEITGCLWSGFFNTSPVQNVDDVLKFLGND